ncbi:MAG: type II toxin-antitoxin system VapC family toxin [Candidatus Nealsonbacteria bacterium]|nr:type II toxin-antitoxin system VapC family toxin [Candidatus Nealsonbacteria bacterium]
MSFLLDTNICSEYLRRPPRLFHRFVQHSGRLYLSAIGLSELYTWAYKQDDPSRIASAIADLLHAIRVLPFDEKCAEVLGRIRGNQLRQGISYGSIDLLIAATALTHDLTLVTHNVKDFEHVPDLRIEDWMAD